MLVSAAMMWDNVRGHWSRQGSIGVSILALLPLQDFFFSLPCRCDKATGADGVWLHTLFLIPFSVCVCVCASEDNLFVGVVCGWELSPIHPLCSLLQLDDDQRDGNYTGVMINKPDHFLPRHFKFPAFRFLTSYNGLFMKKFSYFRQKKEEIMFLFQ